MRAVFRTQRMQATADKERFGDWNRQLASLLEGAVLQLYAEAARSEKAKVELASEFEDYARERARQSAREINDTTSSWLQEGRELSQVFGSERVATIAATEAAFAANAGRAIVAKAGGKKLQWVVGKKPCKFCKSIAGKVVKPGQPFGVHGDYTVYFAPAHPHCYCRVRQV